MTIFELRGGCFRNKRRIEILGIGCGGESEQNRMAVTQWRITTVGLERRSLVRVDGAQVALLYALLVEVHRFLCLFCCFKGRQAASESEEGCYVRKTTE